MSGSILIFGANGGIGSATARLLAARGYRLHLAGRNAEALPTREACGDRLIALARPGDRIIVMGARDDTLSVFAGDLLARLGNQTPGKATVSFAGHRSQHCRCGCP